MTYFFKQTFIKKISFVLLNVLSIYIFINYFSFPVVSEHIIHTRNAK